MEELLQYIANYGFPMVACVGMFWYINRLIEAHKAEIKEMTDALNQNTNKTTEALNKNTAVIERLIDKVGS